MIEGTKSFTGSGAPELPECVLFQSFWCGDATNSEISREYSTYSHDETCPLLWGDIVSETMMDNRVNTPGQTPLLTCIPGYENTGSIPPTCVSITPFAGLLNPDSSPEISGPGIQNFKFPDPDELLSFQEQPGDYLTAIR
jgi:hypothetical protein